MQYVENHFFKNELADLNYITRLIKEIDLQNTEFLTKSLEFKKDMSMKHIKALEFLFKKTDI